MTTPREVAVAAPLPHGKVLLTGGGRSVCPSGLDRATGSSGFSSAGVMTAAGGLAVSVLEVEVLVIEGQGSGWLDVAGG